MKKERNLGIDLLRIISMCLVVLLHVLGRGGVLNNATVFSSHYAVAWFLEIMAYCAVNCYALISGYVGVSHKFKYSSIIGLWFRVVFYTTIISGLFFVVKPETISINNILRAFFPVLFNEYWYFTSYFCLFFFIPFLNILLEKLNKKMMKRLFITIVSIFSIFAMISPTDIFGLSGGYSVLWLSLLYLIGGYLKKYNIFKNWSCKKLFYGFLGCLFFTWISKMLIEIVTINIFGYVRGNMLLVSYFSITILCEAIFLLLLFSKIKIKRCKKFISYLAPLSFSVYIIHTHHLVWEFIMKNRFVFILNYPIYLFPFLVVGSVLIIYAICTLIDIIRNFIFKKLKIKQLSEMIIQKIKESRIVKKVLF